MKKELSKTFPVSTFTCTFHNSQKLAKLHKKINRIHMTLIHSGKYTISQRDKNVCAVKSMLDKFKSCYFFLRIQVWVILWEVKLRFGAGFSRFDPKFPQKAVRFSRSFDSRSKFLGLVGLAFDVSDGEEIGFPRLDHTIIFTLITIILPSTFQFL